MAKSTLLSLHKFTHCIDACFHSVVYYIITLLKIAYDNRDAEMTCQIKVLATESDGLSLSSETHIMETEN